MFHTQAYLVFNWKNIARSLSLDKFNGVILALAINNSFCGRYWCKRKFYFVRIICDQYSMQNITNYRNKCNECSRTSMARTILRPWKFVLDIGSSSHRGLIIAPGKEANLAASIKLWYVECTH